jgi:hypothetical protein
MKNALLKTLFIVMAVAGLVSLTGCNEANSAPSNASTVNAPASGSAATAQENAGIKAPAAADANGGNTEAASEIY